MGWCLVFTVYTGLILVFSSQIFPTMLTSADVSETSLRSYQFINAIAVQPTSFVTGTGSLSSYQPPRDIGRPRRTGPSGGRIA